MSDPDGAFEQLLARIRVADGAQLSSLGQEAAVAHFDHHAISYGELVRLHEAWMDQLNSLAQPPISAQVGEAWMSLLVQEQAALYGQCPQGHLKDVRRVVKFFGPCDEVYCPTCEACTGPSDKEPTAPDGDSPRFAGRYRTGLAG